MKLESNNVKLIVYEKMGLFSIINKNKKHLFRIEDLIKIKEILNSENVEEIRDLINDHIELEEDLEIREVKFN